MQDFASQMLHRGSVVQEHGLRSLQPTDSTVIFRDSRLVNAVASVGLHGDFTSTGRGKLPDEPRPTAQEIDKPMETGNPSTLEASADALKSTLANYICQWTTSSSSLLRKDLEEPSTKLLMAPDASGIVSASEEVFEVMAKVCADLLDLADTEEGCTIRSEDLGADMEMLEMNQALVGRYINAAAELERVFDWLDEMVKGMRSLM